MKTNFINVLVGILAFVMSSLIIAACCVYLGNSLGFRNSKLKRDYQMEKELKYWEVKSRLVTEVKSYIDSNSRYSAITPLAIVNACEEFDIDIRFVLAQAKIESHFGTYGIAARTNSVWNVGAFDGVSEPNILKKYRYKHPDESIRPYLKLLRDKYLVDGRTEQDLLKSYTDLGGMRYASDKSYEEKLKRELDKMTALESVIAEYTYAKLNLNK